MNDADKIACMDLIEALRADEGSYAHIPNSNPDFDNGRKDEVITVVGPWTRFHHREFEGDTLLEALQAAMYAKEKATTPADKNKLIAEKLQRDGGWMWEYYSPSVHCHPDGTMTPVVNFDRHDKFIPVNLADPAYTTGLESAVWKLPYLLLDPFMVEFAELRSEFEQGFIDAAEYGEKVRDIVFDAIQGKDGERDG